MSERFTSEQVLALIDTHDPNLIIDYFKGRVVKYEWSDTEKLWTVEDVQVGHNLQKPQSQMHVEFKKAVYLGLVNHEVSSFGVNVRIDYVEFI